MKTTIKTITMTMVIAAAVAGEARVYGPGEYRPIREAMMDVDSATGSFENLSDVRITMAKQDTDRKPTQLVLSYVLDIERMPSRDINDRISEEFKIIGIEDAGCGSVQYIAEERYPVTGRPSPIRPLATELLLTDHTNRLCHDMIPGLWVAQVRKYYGAAVFEMSLRGNPKPVYTPQTVPSIQTINPVFDENRSDDRVMPIRTVHAGMTKKSATQHFKNVSDVTLAMDSYLGDMSNPFGLTLSYIRPETGETVVEALSITSREELGCGSVQYIANLSQPQLMSPELTYLPVEGDRNIQRRLSVVLIDHTNLTCRIHKPFKWEASVREGYGFCGTMDATMELEGNPELVLRRQN